MKLLKTILQHPQKPDCRIVKYFLFIPKRINGQIKWFEYIWIEQKREYLCDKNNALHLKWVDSKIL